MSIDKTQTSASYIGNGITTTFPMPFPVLEETHVVVAVTNDQGNAVPYVLGNDYQVSITRNVRGDQESAVVTLTDPLPTGWKLVASRVMPIVQEAVFTNQGGASPRVVERQLDYLTMISQQLDANKADKSDVTDALAGVACFAVALREAVATERVERVAGDAAAGARIDNLTPADIGAAAAIHTHGLEGFPGLADEMAAKADRSELANKADVSALQAGLAGKADISQMEDALAGKADLIDGMVPLEQLPLTELTQSWMTTDAAELVTLTAANVGDIASIVSDGVLLAVYKLVAMPPTEIGNWGYVGKGGVDTVQGKSGHVSLHICELNGAANAFASKAGKEWSLQTFATAAELANTAATMASRDYVRDRLGELTPGKLGAMPAAPTDGNHYLAAGDGWQKSPAHGSMAWVDDAPDDGGVYGRRHGAWQHAAAALPAGREKLRILGTDANNACSWLSGTFLAEKILPVSGPTNFGVVKTDGMTTTINERGELVAMTGANVVVSLSHPLATGRELPDQHPIKAITGLGNFVAAQGVINTGFGACLAAARTDIIGLRTDLENKAPKNAATASTPGLMSAEDKAKLDGMDGEIGNFVTAQGVINTGFHACFAATRGNIATLFSQSAELGTALDETDAALAGFISDANAALAGKADMSALAVLATRDELSTALDGLAVLTQTSATLTAAGWSGSAAPYSQTVTLANTDRGIVALSTTLTDAQAEAAGKGWLVVTARTAGNVTVKAFGDKPAVDIPIQYWGE